MANSDLAKSRSGRGFSREYTLSIGIGSEWHLCESVVKIPQIPLWTWRLIKLGKDQHADLNRFCPWQPAQASRMLANPMPKSLLALQPTKVSPKSSTTEVQAGHIPAQLGLYSLNVFRVPVR
jgi:hypothetical protein